MGTTDLEMDWEIRHGGTMNFFLLVAVPLAAVAAHRFLHPQRPAFAEPQAWILGSVWAVASLVVASLFGGWRLFGGDLLAVFGGLTLTDVVLVPGGVVAAWLWTRKGRDSWELGLWLALVFTMAGLRDFVATNRTYDLNELFLVPLGRVLLVLTLPYLFDRFTKASVGLARTLTAVAAGALVLTGSLFPVLSFAGWGWLVWVLVGAGLALSLWAQKKAASSEAAP